MRLGGSLALPISNGFEFFHTFGSCSGMSYGDHGTGKPKDTLVRPLDGGFSGEIESTGAVRHQ